MIKIFNKKEENNTLEIKYDISSGIPFRWEYEIEDKEICEFVESNSQGEKAKEPICGGKVYTTYIFKGLKEGKTKIIFKLINFADDYLSEINEYNIEVDKNHKIALISKEEKKINYYSFFILIIQ